MPITDVSVAMAVINTAKEQGIDPGVMPESDDAKVTKANELLKLAEQAKAAGVQGTPVAAVIAAASQQAGATTAPANPFGAAPVAPPAPVAPAPPAPPIQPPPAPPVAPTDINTVIPNFDDLKVADVLSAMEMLSDEQIAFVKAYEAQEGERPKITNFERHPMTQMPAPQPVVAAPASSSPSTVAFAQVDASQYGSTEPWAGYSKMKIGEITMTVENVVRDHGEAAKPVLAHVWEYESNNKERSSLLKKLSEIATNGVSATAPAPPPEAPDVQPTPPFGAPQVDIGNAIMAAQTPSPAQQPTPPSPATQPLVGATQNAMAMVAAEGLPVPGHIQQPPTLPEDFTVLSDVDVRRFQSQFNACQARSNYLYAVAEGHANDARLVADAAVDAFITSTQFAAKTTVKEMEAQAASTEPVAGPRRVQHEFAEQARQLRALRDIYQHTCERLSREQTARSDEKATTR